GANRLVLPAALEFDFLLATDLVVLHVRRCHFTLGDPSANFPPQLLWLGAREIEKRMTFVEAQSPLPGMQAQKAIQKFDRPVRALCVRPPRCEQLLRYRCPLLFCVAT